MKITSKIKCNNNGKDENSLCLHHETVYKNNTNTWTKKNIIIIEFHSGVIFLIARRNLAKKKFDMLKSQLFFFMSHYPSYLCTRKYDDDEYDDKI